MWKKGKKARILSPSFFFPPFQRKLPPSPADSIRMFDTTFECVNMTPLGWPVVPELYTKKARSFLGSILAFLNLVAPEMFLIFVKCLNLAVSSFSSPIKMIRSASIPTFLHASCATARNGFCVANDFAPESFN